VELSGEGKLGHGFRPARKPGLTVIRATEGDFLSTQMLGRCVAAATTRTTSIGPIAVCELVPIQDEFALIMQPAAFRVRHEGGK